MKPPDEIVRAAVMVARHQLPTVAEANAAGVERSDDPRHAELARWHRYTASEFHERTLEVLGLPTKKDHYP